MYTVLYIHQLNVTQLSHTAVTQLPPWAMAHSIAAQRYNKEYQPIYDVATIDYYTFNSYIIITLWSIDTAN